MELEPRTRRQRAQAHATARLLSPHPRLCVGRLLFPEADASGFMLPLLRS